MTNENLLRLVALKVVSDQTKKLYDTTRETEGEGMEPGQRMPVKSPIDGTKLGTVSMSDPKPTARISDRGAFTAWAEQSYPDDVEWDFEIVGTHEQVAALLYEHAPELVKRVAKVTPRLLKTVLEGSSQFGDPVGPSGELDIPGVVVETGQPRVSCLPADGALPAVYQLMRDRLPLELLAADPDGVA